mgnify:CR=1 FL=1
MPIDKYHPAFKKIVRYSCYPDNLFVKEPESNYRAIPNDPIEGYMWYEDHGGLDAYSSWGSPIYAVADGIVVDVKKSQPGMYGGVASGNLVAIKTNGCIGCECVSAYKHLMDFSVSVGQKIAIGQQIGRQGNSGTKGHHLHFDYFIDKVRYDPVPYLEGRKSFIIQRSVPLVNIAVKAKYQYIDGNYINIRKEPSAKSADIGDLKNGTIFDIEIIRDNEGYTWGKIVNDGWVALYAGTKAWCIPVAVHDGTQQISILEAQIAVLDAENDMLIAERSILEDKISKALVQAEETVMALR